MNSTTTSTKSMKTDRRLNKGIVRHALMLATAGVVSLSTLATAQSTPSQVIEDLSSQVIGVLRDQSVDSSARRRSVEEVIYRYLDFETLSRLVMARNWRTLSDEQQTEFKDEFKKHLSHTYGDNLDNYHNEKVSILSERKEKRGDVTVKSKILRGGNDDILVDYRLRKTEDQWRIIDVVIEGVSLVANFRSQFQEIMSSGGADRLLKLLREKNIDPPPA